jgi:hypothetical protein
MNKVSACICFCYSVTHCSIYQAASISKRLINRLRILSLIPIFPAESLISHCCPSKDRRNLPCLSSPKITLSRGYSVDLTTVTLASGNLMKHKGLKMTGLGVTTYQTPSLDIHGICERVIGTLSY